MYDLFLLKQAATFYFVALRIFSYFKSHVFTYFSDECATANPCMGSSDIITCVNNDGSFTCECIEGYMINGAGTECESK